MPDAAPLDAGQIEAFLIAIGIGLLIGLERERVPSARAGLRTFALVGMLGALVAMLGEQLGSFAPFVAGLVIVALTLIAAYLRHPDPSDPGTTSVAALVVCYCRGAATWLGHAQLAVMLAVATTVLLYFKAQLRGMATRLEARDWISILQFGVLSLVILPILPNAEMGPYGALNPHQIWWMVVLIVVPALAVGVFGALWHWRQLPARGETLLPATRNPTELKIALGFGVAYALVLLAAAWLSDLAGSRGLYVLAFVSGLTDVDAITLSSLRLHALERLALGVTVTAIGIAMLANLAFKLGMAAVIGGPTSASRLRSGWAAWRSD